MTCYGCAKRHATAIAATKTVVHVAHAAAKGATKTVTTTIAKSAPLRADVAAMAARFAQIRHRP